MRRTAPGSRWTGHCLIPPRAVAACERPYATTSPARPRPARGVDWRGTGEVYNPVAIAALGRRRRPCVSGEIQQRLRYALANDSCCRVGDCWFRVERVWRPRRAVRHQPKLGNSVSSFRSHRPRSLRHTERPGSRRADAGKTAMSRPGRERGCPGSPTAGYSWIPCSGRQVRQIAQCYASTKATSGPGSRRERRPQDACGPCVEQAPSWAAGQTQV